MRRIHVLSVKENFQTNDLRKNRSGKDQEKRKYPERKSAGGRRVGRKGVGSPKRVRRKGSVSADG